MPDAWDNCIEGSMELQSTVHYHEQPFFTGGETAMVRHWISHDMLRRLSRIYNYGVAALEVLLSLRMP